MLSPSTLLRTGSAKHFGFISVGNRSRNDQRFFSRDCGIQNDIKDGWYYSSVLTS